MCLLSGFLKFLLDVRERYCSGVTGGERREAQFACGQREHRANFSNMWAEQLEAEEIFVGFGGT